MPKDKLHKPGLYDALTQEGVWTEKKPRGTIWAKYGGDRAYSEEHEIRRLVDECCREKFGQVFYPDYLLYDHSSVFEDKDKKCVAIYQPYNNVDKWFDILDIAWDKGLYIKFYVGHPCIIVVRRRREGEDRPTLPPVDFLSLCGVNVYSKGLKSFGE